MWVIIIQVLLICVYNRKHFHLSYTVAYAQEATIFGVAMGSQEEQRFKRTGLVCVKSTATTTTEAGTVIKDKEEVQVQHR